RRVRRESPSWTWTTTCSRSSFGTGSPRCGRGESSRLESAPRGRSRVRCGSWEARRSSIWGGVFTARRGPLGCRSRPSAGGRHTKRCVADTDVDLVAEPRLDSSDAIEQLLERYGDRVYRLALRITGAEKDTEEVVENTLRTAIDAVDAFASRLMLESWIYRTV